MLIALKIIEKPRKQRRCASLICDHKLITGKQVRIFGAAEQGDKPYAMYTHPECAMQWDDARKKMPA